MRHQTTPQPALRRIWEVSPLLRWAGAWLPHRSCTSEDRDQQCGRTSLAWFLYHFPIFDWLTLSFSGKICAVWILLSQCSGLRGRYHGITNHYPFVIVHGYIIRHRTTVEFYNPPCVSSCNFLDHVWQVLPQLQLAFHPELQWSSLGFLK